MKLDLYAADGSKKGTVDAAKAIFEAKVNEDLMHRAIVMRLANARTPIAHTKGRGEIACSTRKIFRQIERKLSEKNKNLQKASLKSSGFLCFC